MRSTNAINRYQGENAHKVAPAIDRVLMNPRNQMHLLQRSKKKAKERLYCSGSISGMRKSFYVTANRTSNLILYNYFYIFYFRSSIPLVA